MIKKRDSPSVSRILLIPAAVLLFLTMLSYTGMVHRLGELLSHFRLQFLILSVLILIPYAWFRHRWGIILSLSGLVLSGAGIVPLYFHNKLPAGYDGSHQIKILLSNVNTLNTEYRRLLALVEREQPDVVIVQELNHDWDKYLRKNLISHRYKKTYPHRGWYGIGIYSTMKFLDGGIYYWGDERFPSGLVRINPGGRVLTIVSAHPPPPMPFWKFHKRNERLNVLGSKIRRLEGPVVMVGDLNVTPWSPYFARLLNVSGMKNGRKGFGLLPTWPTRMISPLRIPIDHCLIKGNIRVISLKSGPPIGSDHLPLIVTLGF